MALHMLVDCASGEVKHAALTAEQAKSLRSAQAEADAQQRAVSEKTKRREQLREKLTKHSDPLLRELAEHL